jgi:hypothetical protein
MRKGRSDRSGWPGLKLGWVGGRGGCGRGFSGEVRTRKQPTAPCPEAGHGRGTAERARLRLESDRLDGPAEDRRVRRGHGGREEPVGLPAGRLGRNGTPGPRLAQARPVQVQHVEGDVDPHGQEGAQDHTPPRPRASPLRPDVPHARTPMPSCSLSLIDATRATIRCQSRQPLLNLRLTSWRSRPTPPRSLPAPWDGVSLARVGAPNGCCPTEAPRELAGDLGALRA